MAQILAMQKRELEAASILRLKRQRWELQIFRCAYTSWGNCMKQESKKVTTRGWRTIQRGCRHISDLTREMGERRVSNLGGRREI